MSGEERFKGKFQEPCDKGCSCHRGYPADAMQSNIDAIKAEGVDGKPVPVFKGKFQEAAPRHRGRMYPWTPEPKDPAKPTKAQLDHIERLLVEAYWNDPVRQISVVNNER